MKSRYLAKALMAMEKESNLNTAVAKFMNFLQKNNLIYFLPQILVYLQQESLKQKNQNTVKISASFKIQDILEVKIKKLTGADSKVKTDFLLDKDLIGGFKAEYDDIIYDGSLKNQLNKLKEKLKN